MSDEKVRTEDYKGYPWLVIPTGKGYEKKLSVFDCKAIVKYFDEIQQFIEDNSHNNSQSKR